MSKKQLPRFAPVGAIVLSGYWHEHYTVLAHHEDAGDWRGEQVTVRWHERAGQPNEITTHSTPMDWKRDRIIEINRNRNA